VLTLGGLRAGFQSYRVGLGLLLISLVVLAVLVWPMRSHAQTNQLRFQRLNVEHGLPQSRVSAITQDSRGFLWLGTEDGLSRFDGYQFVVYREDERNPRSFSGGSIFSLYAVPAGHLWIGTEKGLNRYDPANDSFTRYLHSDNLSNKIYSICADRAGQLWVGTDTGVSRFDPATGRFTRYRHDPARPESLSHDFVYSTYCDRTGVLWVCTSGGLDRYDPGTGHFAHYRHDPADPASLGNAITGKK